MKRTILFTIFIISISSLFGQQKEEADKLVNDGITLHDSHDYNGAIKKYDEALELDNDNLFALSEKAFSLFSLKEYEKTISICEYAIEKHPESNMLKNVYVTYGNAIDASNNKEKAIETYDKGIESFPDYYQLHFNKGITLSTLKEYDEAIICFKNSVVLNPNHSSSHNALATLIFFNEEYIPSLLAFSRFFVLEPQGSKASYNLQFIRKIMKGTAEETGKNDVTINIDPKMLIDDNSEKIENDFRTPYLILTMDAALDFDKKNKKKTEVELFTRKFETICSSMEEIQKDQFGFYWSYYVPYFIELKQKGFIETFSYLIYASSEEKYVNQWLESNKEKINEFYTWSKEYVWNRN